MSYYGDGVVTADFAGLARKQRQADEPHCCHVYFNGAGGNLGAGKYNDGTPPMRPVLQQRVYEAIVASESDAAQHRQRWDASDPSKSFFEWRSVPLDGLASCVTHHDCDCDCVAKQLCWQDCFKPGLVCDALVLPVRAHAATRVLEEDASFAAEADLLKTIADPTATCVNRNRSAYEVVWLRRARPSGWAANPLLASSLTLNDAVVLYDVILAEPERASAAWQFCLCSPPAV